MNLKRISALLSTLALTLGLICLPAEAAGPRDGVYTASVLVSYNNPDTGKPDDLGGSSNAVLGESMCRSATAPTCLVEVEDGQIWITVRLLLQDSASGVKFWTRTGSNSYSSVKHSIMAEGDASDYRIKVSRVDQQLKASMYVVPMQRDVVWFLRADLSSLTPGSGDFVVSIDPPKPAPEPEKPAPQPEKPKPAPEKPAPQPEKPKPAPEAKPAPSVKPEKPQKPAKPQKPDKAEPAPSHEQEKPEAKPGQPVVSPDRSAETTGPSPEEDKSIQADQSALTDSSAEPSEEETENGEKGGSMAVPVILIVVLVAAGAVAGFVVVKRKK